MIYNEIYTNAVGFVVQGRLSDLGQNGMLDLDMDKLKMKLKTEGSCSAHFFITLPIKHQIQQLSLGSLLNSCFFFIFFTESIWLLEVPGLSLLSAPHNEQRKNDVCFCHQGDAFTSHAVTGLNIDDVLNALPYSPWVIVDEAVLSSPLLDCLLFLDASHLIGFRGTI